MNTPGAVRFTNVVTAFERTPLLFTWMRAIEVPTAYGTIAEICPGLTNWTGAGRPLTVTWTPSSPAVVGNGTV